MEWSELSKNKFGIIVTVHAPDSKPSWRCFLSFPRKRESRIKQLKTWIPAFAGMTLVLKPNKFGMAFCVLRQGAKRIRIILMMATLFVLSACGFKPVYKTTDNKTYELLQKIELAPPCTIEGAEFYNQLKNIIPPPLHTEYILESKLQFSQDFSIIQRNSDVLREIITLKVSYILREKMTDKTITSGKFTRLSSYNTSFSTYENLNKNQQTLTNLAIISAEEVRNRIILYIENSQK